MQVNKTKRSQMKVGRHLRQIARRYPLDWPNSEIGNQTVSPLGYSQNYQTTPSSSPGILSLYGCGNGNSPSYQMLGSFRDRSQPSKKQKKGGWLGVSFQPENLIPGLIIGFICGFFMDLAKSARNYNAKNIGAPVLGRSRTVPRIVSSNNDEELKMVLVVRQDLKMGAGKIASQCAHAATGMYSELMQSHRSLLRQWELCGQAKIVVTCKNQQEMNRLKEAAEGIGLPTFVVADAGRTQIAAGSKTVLAIGPGNKSVVDSVTGKLRLL